MPTTEEIIEGLIKARIVKPAFRDQDQIDQYIANAKGMFGDAQIASLSIHGRFILAYEGVHCLAMALLNHFGVRHDSEGHRRAALQFFIQQVGLNQHFPFVSRMHDIRNLLTYERPAPPVSEMDVKALIGILGQSLTAIRSLMAQDNANTPPVAPTRRK